MCRNGSMYTVPGAWLGRNAFKWSREQFKAGQFKIVNVIKVTHVYRGKSHDENEQFCAPLHPW